MDVFCGETARHKHSTKRPSGVERMKKRRWDGGACFRESYALYPQEHCALFEHCSDEYDSLFYRSGDATIPKDLLALKIMMLLFYIERGKND